MALKEVESADTSETLVEGYVVDHGLVWDAKLVKSHSVGGFLNLDSEERQTRQQPQQQQRPPKVSVTLSEYLSAASPNADPSCDFGWFTPTASASSLLAADSQDIGVGGAYPAPSPSHGRTTFLFPSTRVDSGKTASLSPESGGLGNAGDGVGDRSQRSLSVVGAATGEGGRQQQAGAGMITPSAPAYPTRTNHASFPKLPQQQPPLQQQQQQLAPAEGRDVVVGRSGAGGARGGGSLRDSSGGMSTGMGVQLLPICRSRSTTTHLNSWHTLYGSVSESGSLSSRGRCTMHLRRASFLISTRTFPEKPPTPRLRSGWGGGGGGAGQRVGVALLPHGQGGRGGGAAAAAAAAQLHRHHQAAGNDGYVGRVRGDGGGRSGGSRKAGQKQEQRQEEQQQQHSGSVKPKSYSWALTEIRVRKGSQHFPFPAEPPYAEYLVVVCMGRERLVAGWRRASDFEKLAQAARKAWMPKASVAWEALEKARRMHGGGPCNIPLVIRPRRLDALYLQNKARFLEEFLKQFFFEANSKEALLSFLDTKKPATMEI